MQWRQTVAETFRRALLVEVERRSEIPIYCFEKSSSGYTTLKEEIPDSVTMVTTSGHRVTLPFPKERYAYSLIKGGAENSTLTYLLDRYPISIDSLQQTWDSLLQRKQIDVSTSIRYTLTDVSGRTDTLYSRPSLFVQPVDSTLMWYMGYRCERQFVGCAAIPDFVTRPLHLLSLLAKLGLEALLLLFVWHYYDSAIDKIRRKFSAKEIVHVADAQIKEAKVYDLGDDAIYEVFTQTIRRGNSEYKLAPQSGILFLLFLRMPEHHVSMNDIYQYLWEGGGTKERVHSAIRRLRNELKAAPVQLEIDYVSDGYQLKKAHFIEENDSVSNGQ